MRFTKMQGIGNDYVYVNCFEEAVRDPAATAIRISRPHFGIGADGLVMIQPSDVADFAMRMFNADGSEGEMCGNACRCIGKYVYEKGLTDKTTVSLMTGAGLKELKLNVQNGKVQSVRVDMGSPELNPRLIPVNLPGEIVLGQELFAGGRKWRISCVSMGNPHCVIFVDHPETTDVEFFGPMIECADIFPRHTNVEFIHVDDRHNITMRVWERGSGETLACGTGACAALVAAVLSGRADREVTMHLAGGDLQLSWSADDNHVYQEGPAEFVFSGEIDD